MQAWMWLYKFGQTGRGLDVLTGGNQGSNMLLTASKQDYGLFLS